MDDGFVSSFPSYDGTKIGYRTVGTGRPLVCLPGGPGRAVDYLGDLGGLSASRQLVLPDTRGTGASADASDPATYRCDRLAGDVEALRAHLGLEQMDLLGHSAAGDLATLYAAAHPGRVTHLILLTPGLRAVGLQPTAEQEHAAMRRRSGEPWYPQAEAAVAKAESGDFSAENRRAYMPLLYARWDEAAQAHAFTGMSPRAAAVREWYGAEGAFDPEATRAALGALTAPVLVYVGGLDLAPGPELAREAAALFPRAEVVVQPGAGHFPWLDDPAALTAALTAFLG